MCLDYVTRNTVTMAHTESQTRRGQIYGSKGEKQPSGRQQLGKCLAARFGFKQPQQKQAQGEQIMGGESRK